MEIKKKFINVRKNIAHFTEIDKQIWNGRRKEREQKVKEELKEVIRQIILLTSYEDEDGTVWGMDTSIDSMENLIEHSYNQIKDFLKNE